MVVALAPGLGAQSTDDSVQQAVATYSAWADKLAEFTKGIEFDEGDLTTLIEQYPEMQALDVAEADGDVTDPAQFDNHMRQVLAEPEYRSWASRNGLDPERWLRTVARISSVHMIVNMERSRPAAEAQRREFELMVEKQCATSDAETCRSMREALAAGDAMSDALAKAQGKLPAPTAAELALMNQYFDRLTAAMSDEDSSSMEEPWEDSEEYSDPDE
jgi:hypothetical protein